jgi:hypothetical protein
LRSYTKLNVTLSGNIESFIPVYDTVATCERQLAVGECVGVGVGYDLTNLVCVLVGVLVTVAV